LISATAFAFFAWHVAAQRKTQSLPVACIALVCMVCLLFPVISMTDDLNSSLAMPEANKLKRLVDLTQSVHLFSFVLVLVIYAPQACTAAAFALEHKIKPADQARSYFNLNRRPPPSIL
jgi:hypothetical protein